MPNLLVLHTKPRPSFSCPSFKNISSVFCLFSYEKSVGLLSLLLFWLVCSGHNNYLLCKTINYFMCGCFYQTTDLPVRARTQTGSLYITLKIFQGLPAARLRMARVYATLACLSGIARSQAAQAGALTPYEVVVVISPCS